MAATRNKIESLQALRAIAALCVVAHHAFRAVTVNADPALGLPEPRLLFSERFVEIGAFGVDLFFILSGFLMVVIAGPYVEGRRPKSDFIVQRIIRVWPLYALATLLLVGLKLAAWGVRGGPMPFDLDLVRLLSLAFVPSFNENGVLQPILGVGWTLNYEFLFYLVFLAALVAGTRQVFATLCAFLAAVFAVGLALPADTAPGAFLANPILFEFLFGGAVAVLWRKGLLPKGWGWPLVALGIAALWAFAFVPNESVLRVFARGLPCLLIFAGVLLLNDRLAWPRWLVFLGDASYSIYLFHILVVYQAAGATLRFLVGNGVVDFAPEIASAVGIVTSVAVGCILHKALEVPMTRILHERYDMRRQWKLSR